MCLFVPNGQSPEDPMGGARGIPCFWSPWASLAMGTNTWGHGKACLEGGYWCPVSLQSQHQARPYLGPAAEEQVQHVLTDLVVVFIQKLVNLANSRTSW